jgi:ferric-dicitrate binding protein FerR (iron transport regulator)
MNQPTPHMKGLILRFLKKEATQEEFLELQIWLAQDKENIRYFDRQNVIFQRETAAQRLTPERVVQSWEKLNSRINTTKKSTTTPVVALLRSNFFRIAASVSISAIVIWKLLPGKQFENPVPTENTIVLKSTNRNAPIVLPDSTLVWLNANSTIEYTSTFSEKREVNLKGEGFFDVRKKGKQTFVVKTAHFSIQVKGTRFNVQAYESEYENATLEEGSIEFKLYGEEQTYPMTPGDQITINNTAQTIIRKKVDPLNFTAWKEEKLVFDNSPLSDIILKIENRYHVNVIIDESLANRERLTMTIEHEPIEEILEMIHLSSELNYKIENETIQIYE